MPNGSHGGGEISSDDLLRCFDSLHEDGLVGQLWVARLPGGYDIREVAVSEIRHLIQSTDQKRILIEQIDINPQVGTALVVHLYRFDKIAETHESGRLRWLHVTEDRPVFHDLEKLWLEAISRNKTERPEP